MSEHRKRHFADDLYEARSGDSTTSLVAVGRPVTRDMETAEALRALRTRAGVSQERVARDNRLSVMTIRRWERGENVSADKVRRLTEYYHRLLDGAETPGGPDIRADTVAREHTEHTGHTAQTRPQRTTPTSSKAHGKSLAAEPAATQVEIDLIVRRVQILQAQIETRNAQGAPASELERMLREYRMLLRNAFEASGHYGLIVDHLVDAFTPPVRLWRSESVVEPNGHGPKQGNGHG